MSLTPLLNIDLPILQAPMAGVQGSKRSPNAIKLAHKST